MLKQKNLFGKIAYPVSNHRHKWKDNKQVPYFEQICKCGQRNHIKFITSKW